MTRTRAPSGLDIVVDPSRVEASLWRRFCFEDDARSRERLFNRYFGLARLISGRLFRQRQGKRLERSDFDQLASEGLLQAIDRFDPLQGVPFSAYARRRIAGNVTDGVARMTEIDAQLSYRHRVERERARSLLTEDADALTMLSELAAGLAIGLMLDGTGLAAADIVADDQPDPYDSLAWRETQAVLVAEVERLPETEASIIRQHYDHGLAFAQVAQLMGLSRGRISQLHRAALARLRKRLISRK